MSINHSQFRYKSFLALSILVIVFSGNYFLQNKEKGKVTEPVDQPHQGITINSDLKTEFSQTKIEAILISKRGSPIRANRQWVELEKSIANKLWSHLRSKQIDASDYFHNDGGLPSFAPPNYDVIVMLNDREKLNLTMDGAMEEVLIDSRELYIPCILLRYDKNLVTSIDKILDASVE